MAVVAYLWLRHRHQLQQPACRPAHSRCFILARFLSLLRPSSLPPSPPPPPPSPPPPPLWQTARPPCSTSKTSRPSTSTCRPRWVLLLTPPTGQRWRLLLRRRRQLPPVPLPTCLPPCLSVSRPCERTLPAHALRTRRPQFCCCRCRRPLTLSLPAWPPCYPIPCLAVSDVPPAAGLRHASGAGAPPGRHPLLPAGHEVCRQARTPQQPLLLRLLPAPGCA